MNSNEWDDCFLLHHRPHGETSLIVDVFTKKNGKMSIIAKGAKKPKSKFFGYLAPFTKLKITYAGRSELKILTNIDRDFSESTNALEMLGYGLDFENEIDKNQPIDINKNYSFIPERGFRESNNSSFSGKDIINIRMRNLSEVSKKHLKHLTKESIYFCLDGRNLSSREIFRRIK